MATRSAAKRLFQSAVSITAFQASSYILGMINLPYLTRTLGIADYGVLSLTISINAYLWLMMDWGFSIGATRDVAQASADPARLREIFWRTMAAKAIMSAFALVVLAAVVKLSSVPDVFFVIFLPGAINIVSAIFTVDWLVQGLQRMGMFAVWSIAGRSLTIVLTFVLVHGPKDLWIACCVQSFGGLVAGLAGFMVILRFFSIGRPIIRLRSAVEQIWEYRHYFLVQSNWIAYSTAAPLLLTIVSGPVAVGLFAGAERIGRIITSLLAPLTIALYPYINALVVESREAAARVAGLLLAFQILFGVVLFFVLVIYAEPIVALILGPRFTESADVLRCLAILPLVTGVASTVSRQCLIPLGLGPEVSRINIGCTLIYLILLLLLGRYGGALGAAFALVITEALFGCVLVALLQHRERRFLITACRSAIQAPGVLFRRQRVVTRPILKRLTQLAGF